MEDEQFRDIGKIEEQLIVIAEFKRIGVTREVDNCSLLSDFRALQVEFLSEPNLGLSQTTIHQFFSRHW